MRFSLNITSALPRGVTLSAIHIAQSGRDRASDRFVPGCLASCSCRIDPGLSAFSSLGCEGRSRYQRPPPRDLMAFTVADVARQEVIGVAMPARRQLALEVEAVHPRKPQVE